MLNIVVGSHIGLKELQDQNPSLSSAQWEQVYLEYNSQTMTKLKIQLIPFWRYNRYIYPGFFILIVALFMYSRKRPK